MPSDRGSKDGKDLELGTPVLYRDYTTPRVNYMDGHRSEDPHGASLPLLLVIAMPRMPIMMAWAAQWAAIGPYLGTMMPKWSVQLAQVIGPLSGILVGPTIGVLSDNSTSKWGRRRPIMLGAAIASVICWICMGYTREMGEACGDYGNGRPGVPTSRKYTIFFTLVTYIWMDVTVNMVQTPAFLLVADFAGDRQTTGAALGQGWATIGAILVSGYIQIWGPAHETLHYFLGMLCVVMAVTVGLVCLVARETPLEKTEANTDSSSKRIGEAFYSIYKGLCTLPDTLMVYALIMFCVLYGFTAYNGNKGQFFGFEVFDGDAIGAASCGNACTEAQKNFNHGVHLAGGSTDLMFSGVGYLFSWILPFIVSKLGAKWTLSIFLIPQCLLMVMAFTKVVAIDVFIAVITTLSVNVVFALFVPVIVHVCGDKTDIGIYVGALNSANCFGQLLNFAIGTALVETSLGYKLPVFLGGVMSLLGVLITVFLLKIKMYSM